MKYQLEYPYELSFYKIELIHNDGTSEYSFPSRMTYEFAEDMAKNTIDSEEQLVDYRIIKMTDQEAEASF